MKKVLFVLLIIALLAGFYFLFIYDNKTETFKLGNNVSTSDNINFKLNLKHHKKEDIEEYKFSDSLVLKLEFIGIEEIDSLNYYRYKLSINDKFVFEDGTTGDTRLVTILDKSIILKNDQNTDERSTKIFVYSYSGEKIGEIHELEDKKGMIPNKFEVKDGKLVVTGSRINHKYSVEYDGKSYVLCSDSVNKLDDIPVVKEYTYTVKGIISKEKDITLQTLSQYLEKNKCM